MDRISEYFTILKKSIGNISIEDMHRVELAISSAIISGKHIYVAGNGGSALTASHFVCDLVKGCEYEDGIKAYSLADNTALITAFGNDEGYRRIFIGQMKAHGVEEGDLLIAYSGSGSSQNILDAMAYAKEKKMTVIGFCGSNDRLMIKYANYIVSVPSDDMQIIEDAHMAISHCLFKVIKGAFNG